MNARAKIKNVLRTVYGDFNTLSLLENEYEKIITKELIEGDIIDKKQWITYNQVILELKHNIRDMLKVRELQYRLTNEEEPNSACIDVIEHVNEEFYIMKKKEFNLGNDDDRKELYELLNKHRLNQLKKFINKRFINNDEFNNEIASGSIIKIKDRIIEELDSEFKILRDDPNDITVDNLVNGFVKSLIKELYK
jgi:hypothetical protein